MAASSTGGIVYVSPEFRKRLHPGNYGLVLGQGFVSEDRFERYELKDRGTACLSPAWGKVPQFPYVAA